MDWPMWLCNAISWNCVMGWRNYSWSSLSIGNETIILVKVNENVVNIFISVGEFYCPWQRTGIQLVCQNRAKPMLDTTESWTWIVNKSSTDVIWTSHNNNINENDERWIAGCYIMRQQHNLVLLCTDSAYARKSYTRGGGRNPLLLLSPL